jgi:hypothetical protein
MSRFFIFISALFFAVFLTNPAISSEASNLKIIQLINRTGFDILSVQLSPAGENQWGDNILVSRVFEKNKKEVIKLTAPDSTVCDYDVKALKINGETIIFKNLNLCHLLNITLYFEDNQAFLKQNIIIENHTRFTFDEIYISEADMDFWSPNVLGSIILNDEDEAGIAFTPSANDCFYDLRAKTIGGLNLLFKGIVMCRTFKVTLFWGEGVPYFSFWGM